MAEIEVVQKKKVRQLDWWITRVYAPLFIAWVSWVSKGLVDVQNKMGEMVGELKQISSQNEVSQIRDFLKQLSLKEKKK